MNRRFGTTLLLLSAALPLPAASQDVKVTGQEIQDQWAGKELVGSGVTGARLFLRLEKDGKATVAVGSLNDTGTWRAVDTGYCATWVTIRKGEERCFTVVKSGSSYKVYNPDGSLSGTITAVR